jgi:hypothetical protein
MRTARLFPQRTSCARAGIFLLLYEERYSYCRYAVYT